MEGSFYPGPLPIGIVAGIVLLIQIALLILCIRNILTFRFQWIIALTMLMSGFSILGTGFFFIGWFLFFIAWKIQFVENLRKMQVEECLLVDVDLKPRW